MICENGCSYYRKFEKMRVKVVLKGFFNGVRGKLFIIELIIIDRRSGGFLMKNWILV